MRRENPNRFQRSKKILTILIIYIFISLFYYFMIYIFSYQILGFINPTPPLTEISSLRFVRKGYTEGLVCNSTFSLIIVPKV
jgi:hypothetical protein